MIVVKVELHSALTGKISEIGKAVVWNDGTGTERRGNYGVRVFRKGRNEVVRQCRVSDFPRLSYSVWRLVLRALRGCFPEES